MTKIRLMGDVMIGRLVNDQISKKGFSYPWGNILSILKEPGLNIINLETTLTGSKKKLIKVFNFKAEANKINTLTEGNIHIANIANNHILDFDKEGMFETIKMLDEAKIKHTGAGLNLIEARKAAYYEVDQLKVAVLGCTDNEPGWKANNVPGVHYVKIGNTNELKEDVIEARKHADLIILSIHWGPNMVEEPSDSQIRFAHELIDLGVDIIHGHSAHIFQGIEIYKGKLIFYDTGDFIDDYMVDSELRNDRSFLFECIVSKNKIKGVKLYPVLIENMQVNIAEGHDKQYAFERMRLLSEKYGTDISEEGEIAI